MKLFFLLILIFLPFFNLSNALEENTPKKISNETLPTTGLIIRNLIATPGDPSDQDKVARWERYIENLKKLYREIETISSSSQSSSSANLVDVDTELDDKKLDLMARMMAGRYARKAQVEINKSQEGLGNQILPIRKGKIQYLKSTEERMQIQEAFVLDEEGEIQFDQNLFIQDRINQLRKWKKMAYNCYKVKAVGELVEVDNFKKLAEAIRKKYHLQDEDLMVSSSASSASSSESSEIPQIFRHGGQYKSSNDKLRIPDLVIEHRSRANTTSSSARDSVDAPFLDLIEIKSKNGKKTATQSQTSQIRDYLKQLDGTVRDGNDQPVKVRNFYLGIIPVQERYSEVCLQILAAENVESPIIKKVKLDGNDLKPVALNFTNADFSSSSSSSSSSQPELKATELSSTQKDICESKFSEIAEKMNLGPTAPLDQSIKEKGPNAKIFSQNPYNPSLYYQWVPASDTDNDPRKSKKKVKLQEKGTWKLIETTDEFYEFFAL